MLKNFISLKMKIFLLILLVLSIIFYASGCIILINSDYKLSDYSNEFNFSFLDFNSNKYSSSQSYNISDDVNELDFNLTSQDIQINMYSGNTLNVKLKNNFSSTLNIPFTENDHKLSFNADYSIPDSSTIIIEIPQNFSDKGNLKISTSNGDIHIKDLNCNSITISTGSGEISAVNSTFNYVDSDSSSGDINFSNLNSLINTKLLSNSGYINGNGNLGELTCNTSSGDINLKFLDSLNTSFLSSESGDVHLHIPTNLSYKVKYKTLTGDLNCSKDLLYSGDNSPEININTKNGDLNISNS